MRVVAVAALALAAMTASGASAAPTRDQLLRPGVGAGKVRLDMTLSQVRAVLGKPVAVIARRRFGTGRYVEYSWDLWKIGFYSRGGGAQRVVMLATPRRERTRGGVGVGSTHEALHRRLGARCYRMVVDANSPVASDPRRPFVVCYLGRDGRAVTAFNLTTDCTVQTDQYLPCPQNRRRYRAYEVRIMSPLGQRLLDRCGERAYTREC